MSQSCEPVFLFRDEVHFSYHVSVPLHGRLDVNRQFFEGEVEVVLPYIRYMGTWLRAAAKGMVFKQSSLENQRENQEVASDC